MKRLVKLSISLVIRACDVLGNSLGRVFGRIPPPVCNVLYYHQIKPDQREQFARQMDQLLRLAQPITCECTTNLSPGRHYAAVSFDDGFVNVLENALPELERRQIPAMIFIPTGYLGQPAGWGKKANGATAGPQILSEKTLAEVGQRPLVSIGSHSVSHPNFLALPTEQALEELSHSRQELERILGRPVTCFSFPFGKHNSSLLELARKAGYQRVFLIEPKLALRTPGEFAVGRVAVEPGDWALEFRLKLLGAYRWQTTASEIKAWLRGSGASTN